MTHGRRRLRSCVALFALGGLAASAAAAPASSRLCRVVTLLQCAPDLCSPQRLPGTAAAGEMPPLDPFAAGRRTSVSYDPERRILSLCWDGRCSDGNVATPWRAGPVFGASGRIREAFARGAPGDAAFSVMFEQRAPDPWLYFSMTVHPDAEQDDYYLLHGNCEPTP